MSWVDQTLADFGRGMGIPQLAFSEKGHASLAFESLGTLFLERAEEATVVYLARPLDRGDGRTYARALRLCHWERQNPWPVNPALGQDRQLAFAVRISDTDFTLPVLEQVVALLDRMHQETREGSAS